MDLDQLIENVLFDLGDEWGNLAATYRRLHRMFSLQVASHIDIDDIDCHIRYHGKSVT